MTNIPETIRSGMIQLLRQMCAVHPRIVIKEKPQIVQTETDFSQNLFNRVIKYEGSEADIPAILNQYRARKVNFAWLIWSHDENADKFARYLEGNGLKRVGSNAGMWLPLSGWQHEEPSRIPGFEIRSVHSEADMEQFRQVVLTTFDLHNDVGEAMLDALVGPSTPFRHYIGTMDGQTVAGVTAFYNGDTIGIYNVVTLTNYRRKGIGAALTAHAIREGQADGGRIAVLQASQMGQSVYQSLGFKVAVDIGIYVD